MSPTRHARRIAPLLVAASLQVACTPNLLGSRLPPPETYRLGTAPAAAPADATRDALLALTVVRPRSSTALDTDRIAVVPGPSRFEYYTGVRWAEAAPQMVQQNLVAALEASGRFGGVFAAPARAPSELMLDLELRHFEAHAAASGDTPVVHVQLQASLVDARRAERVTSFVSEARVPIGDDRRAAIIAAFEQASAQVTADVVARAGEAAAGVASPAK